MDHCFPELGYDVSSEIIQKLKPLELYLTNESFAKTNIAITENMICEAALCGELDVFDYLHKRINVEIDHSRLMKSAISGGNVEICELVYDRDFHYNISDLVWDACKSRQKSSFVWLFDKAVGYDLEELLFVFLHPAVFTDFSEGIEFLTEMGIDVK